MCDEVHPSSLTRDEVDLKISPEVDNSLANFTLPAKLGFGQVMAPIVVQMDYADGRWGELELLPYGALTMEPCAKSLHYPQIVFEGQRAALAADGSPLLFRPMDHHARFNRSCQRMAMPEVSQKFYLSALEELVVRLAPWIPRQLGSSLYIRPFMFATQSGLGIQPSLSYRFMVIASPSEELSAHSSLSVLIERQYVRAAHGGTGNIKAGGNYSASMISTQKANRVGAQQSLWLDDLHREYIEELSGMNFFAVIRGELHTPELTDTILPGITRDSILKIAQSEGIKVHERAIGISEIFELIRIGDCSECFASGTAAALLPIGAFVEENGSKIYLPQSKGQLTSALKSSLVGGQRGENPKFPSDWLVRLSSQQRKKCSMAI